MNSLFGTKHLLILAVCALAIVLGVLAVRKWPMRRLVGALLYIGVASEITKVVYYIIANEAKYGGILPKSDLPFQLCSIQILFALIIFLTQSRKLHSTLLSVMYPGAVLGGIAALLIATDSSRNGGLAISLQYFGYHCALVIFGISLMLSKEEKFTIWHYFQCLKMMLAIFLVAIYLNSMMYDGTSSFNFMYVADPPQKGLPYLNEDKGWGVYIARYGLLVVGCITVCYIKPIIQAITCKVRKGVAHSA